MRGDYEIKIEAIPLISTKRTNTPKKQHINVSGIILTGNTLVEKW